jgi:FkbM family methyltransferase
MRKVYIDCGSNKGKVTRNFILEGNKDYEYFLFEPLPLFHVSYNIGEILSSEFPDVKINYSDNAVWVENTEMEFYVCGRGNEGSSVCENKHSNKMDHKNPLKVQGFNFSQWLMDNFSPDDHIIIKMDIEGAEYDVLPKMIEDGSIEYANEMLIEFHGRRQLSGDYIHERYKEIHDYFEKSEVKLTKWW